MTQINLEILWENVLWTETFNALRLNTVYFWILGRWIKRQMIHKHSFPLLEVVVSFLIMCFKGSKNILLKRTSDNYFQLVDFCTIKKSNKETHVPF